MYLRRLSPDPLSVSGSGGGHAVPFLRQHKGELKGVETILG